MSNLRLYMEDARGTSTSKAGFSIRGAGRSSRNYIIGDDGQRSNGSVIHAPITSRGQVHLAVEELLGSTGYYPAADGRLRRVLPLADPYYPWLFVESIGSIYGMGHPEQSAADPLGFMEADPLDYVTTYPSYKFSDVSFTPRPYESVQDDEIQTGVIEYVNQQGFAAHYQYAKEWERFVDVDTVPAGEYITANAGRFVFDVASALAPKGQPAGDGQLRMFVRKKMLKMTWFQVPNSYTIGSATQDTYIDQAIGTINQTDWWRYPKGSLLLEGAAINRYLPFLPKAKLSGSGQILFTNEKLCDITFMFSYLNPPLGKDSAGAEATPSAAAIPGQHVQAGHNLAPYAHMSGWYYVKTQIPKVSDADNRPIYPSFEYALLFTNPGIV